MGSEKELRGVVRIRFGMRGYELRNTPGVRVQNFQ